ncbi:FecR family protein [Alcaligenaceae bacterium B3P038]|nr:FecR family protein [Alcaligenaceae bacterium B3P038]
MSSTPLPQPPSQALLSEASEWMVAFTSEGVSAQMREDFERWRAQSPAHRAAWQRAEGLFATLDQLPVEVARPAFDRLDHPERRRAVRALGALLVMGPAAWIAYRQLPWLEWTATYQTRTGEQRTVALADGTTVIMNTGSAMDVRFTATERRVVLHRGEVLATTGRDPAPAYRPFIVATVDGMARALGTQFIVRREDTRTRVIVLADTVLATPMGGASVMLGAGQQTTLREGHADAVQPADRAADAWQTGMFVAQNITLQALVDELSRYRRGVLRCHAGIAELRVSGAFPVRDPEASLRLIEKTMPVRIARVTRFWVTIEAL